MISIPKPFNKDMVRERKSAGIMGYLQVQNELQSTASHQTEINKEWSIGPNVKPETMTFLQENKGKISPTLF